MLKEEGFAKLPRRADEERPPGIRPTRAGRADVRTLSLQPRQVHTKLQRHYVFKRSRRQKGILAFLAQDGEKRFFCYANSDLRKEQQNDEILRFVRWCKAIP